MTDKQMSKLVDEIRADMVSKIEIQLRRELADEYVSQAMDLIRKDPLPFTNVGCRKIY